MILVIFVAVILLLSGGFGGIGMALSNASNGMSISSIVAYAFGGIMCWMVLIGGIYYLTHKDKPSREQASNFESLVNDLCDFARSDNYVYVYVDLSRDPSVCSSLCFKTSDSNSANYYFNQHGYAAIRVERIFDVLDALGDRLNGYVIRNYSEFCRSGFYSDDPDNVYLLLGEAAAVERKKREAYENSNMNHKKLKQI